LLDHIERSLLFIDGPWVLYARRAFSEANVFGNA
jgi:hypothetical protein